jgi:formylglycine-generating enzyme required for sulfatase activity
MGRNPSSFKGENHPVENVKWLEANEYCKKIGKRLPTEAEWEKAAQVKNPTKYFWGNDMVSGRANFCDKNCLSDWKATEFDDGFVNTAPVGSYAPNAYGLYDMAGNVWEWVFDWYGDVYYPKSSPHDPKGPVDPLQSYYRLGERVLRGGSWSSHPFNLRSSARAGAFFDTTNINGYGFRCAISALSSN